MALTSAEKYRRWADKHPEEARESNRVRQRRYRQTYPAKAREGNRVRQQRWRQTRPQGTVPSPHSGKCPICHKEKMLVYDHDHDTKKHRGWICNTCNLGIGLLGDTVVAIERAFAYLKSSSVT